MIIDSMELSYYVANAPGVCPYFCKEFSSEQEAYKYAAGKVEDGMPLDDIDIIVCVSWYSKSLGGVSDEVGTYVLRDEDKEASVRKYI